MRREHTSAYVNIRAHKLLRSNYLPAFNYTNKVRARNNIGVGCWGVMLPVYWCSVVSVWCLHAD